MAETAGERAGFWRRFGVLFAFGLLGVVGLVPIIAPAARQQLDSMPEIGISYPVFLALSLVNPLILLAVGTAAGVLLARRVGLRSYVDERITAGIRVLPRLREDMAIAVLLGAIGGTTLILLDLALQPWVAESLGEPGNQPSRSLVYTLSAILYGGITEELMLRWGLMTFLAWAVWRTVGRGRGAPGAGVMWGAIVGAAVAFGFGHLPALAASVTLTTPLIVRTVALNAIGGLVFGWLFWRRSLEAAMIAHGTFQVVFSAFAWLS